MKQRITTNSETHKDINETGLMLQFLSQFCAIQSCFIFSKVAYGISNKFKKLMSKFKKFDISDVEFSRRFVHILPEYRNQERLNALKNIDRKFIADVKLLWYLMVTGLPFTGHFTPLQPSCPWPF